MLKKRLIPILLLKNGRMIKTIKFEKERDVGNPITTARVYNSQNVDELIFLDITASVEGRKAMIDIISEVTKECFMPLTLGGGVKTIEDFSSLVAREGKGTFWKDKVRWFLALHPIDRQESNLVDGKPAAGRITVV